MGKDPKKIMKRDVQRLRKAPYVSDYNNDYDTKEQAEFNKSMDELARKMRSKDGKVRAEAREAWDDMVFYEKEKTDRYLKMKAVESRTSLPSKETVRKKYAGISEARRAEDDKFHEIMGVKEAVDAEMKRPAKKTPRNKQTAQTQTIRRNYER